MSSELARQYHSITFKDALADTGTNTWDDWHLIPSTRPSIAVPKTSEKYIEVPGRHGALDLSGFLTGSPTFSTRTGTWEFYVDHDQWNSWAETYSTILWALHGKILKVILDDDPEWYYEGRFNVSNWQTNKDYSTITIGYTLDPFKMKVSDNGTTKRL